MLLKEKECNITHLLTTIDVAEDRVSIHGVRKKLLEQQARALDLKLVSVELSSEPGAVEYELKIIAALQALKADGCTHGVFGDIFLEDLRKYREELLAKENITCVFPLWKRSSLVVAGDFLRAGFKSIVVCVNKQFLDESFCGRMFNHEFIADLPAGVDPCGENGEFHTFVYDDRLFRRPVLFEKGAGTYRHYNAPRQSVEIDVSRVGFYYCDLIPVGS